MGAKVIDTYTVVSGITYKLLLPLLTTVSQFHAYFYLKQLAASLLLDPGMNAGWKRASYLELMHSQLNYYNCNAPNSNAEVIKMGCRKDSNEKLMFFA